MSTLEWRLANYLRENNFEVDFSTPVEEIEPIRDEKGDLWAMWRHTGEVRVSIRKQGEDRHYYYAYRKHRLFDALGDVMDEIAKDLGIV